MAGANVPNCSFATCKPTVSSQPVVTSLVFPLGCLGGGTEGWKLVSPLRAIFAPSTRMLPAVQARKQDITGDHFPSLCPTTAQPISSKSGYSAANTCLKPRGNAVSLVGAPSCHMWPTAANPSPLILY